MVSLMLCVVLLNSAGTAAGSLDVEKQVEYMIRTDFAVVNVDSTNGQKGFTTRVQGLSSETMEAIAARPGVSGASAIYKNTREDVDVTYAFGITADDDFHVMRIPVSREGHISGTEIIIGLGSARTDALCAMFTVWRRLPFPVWICGRVRRMRRRFFKKCRKAQAYWLEYPSTAATCPCTNGWIL